MTIPLAIGAGIIRGGIGLLQAKHEENVRKKLLGESYDLAQKQLQYRQTQVRENQGESMVARGMMGGGQASNTIGGQQSIDTEKQLGLERSDLALQNKEALAGIKGDFSSQATGAVEGGVSTAMNIAGAFGYHPLTAAPQNATAAGSVSGAMVGAPGTPNYDFSVSPEGMGY